MNALICCVASASCIARVAAAAAAAVAVTSSRQTCHAPASTDLPVSNFSSNFHSRPRILDPIGADVIEGV